MLNINKYLIVDESNKPVAVQIALEDFIIIEELLEKYGLTKLIDECKHGKSLSLKDGQEFYRNSK